MAELRCSCLGYDTAILGNHHHGSLGLYGRRRSAHRRPPHRQHLFLCLEHARQHVLPIRWLPSYLCEFRLVFSMRYFSLLTHIFSLSLSRLHSSFTPLMQPNTAVELASASPSSNTPSTSNPAQIPCKRSSTTAKSHLSLSALSQATTRQTAPSSICPATT